MEEFFAQENQVITIVLIGVLMLLLMGVALLLFFFFSRKKIVEKELEKRNLEVTHQKEIIQSIIITQEEERKRIAQDLHDDISSKLNVINLNANLLKDGELSPEEYLIVNNGILEATDKTLESARKIAHNLLPPILEEFGFKDAVEELADTFNNSRKINIAYTINYPNKYLNPQNELHLFRITQELINNSVRHGKANNSTIHISQKNNKLIFSYTDNGIGFNTDNIDNKKGLGMKNIESRISLLNGQYSIGSEIGNGFKILIVIYPQDDEKN
ncbi:sensor histidine kinase [Polaribacter butkevichii]|uniref:histidine kinase n=1 Tax=Polaribacter butkevichii TaxID=218490 RepID=A0A2P6C8C8_9FLAO|nr:ATP-binding protein [Polaribacter butkevichii]PQJ69171.1 two-component sensor histidine kinase [Polaribacter butkevichii]